MEPMTIYDFGVATFFSPLNIEPEKAQFVYSIDPNFVPSDEKSSWVMLSGDNSFERKYVDNLVIKINVCELIVDRNLSDFLVFCMLEFLKIDIQTLGTPIEVNKFNFSFSIYAPANRVIAPVATNLYFKKIRDVTKTNLGRVVNGYVEYKVELKYDENYNLMLPGGDTGKTNTQGFNFSNTGTSSGTSTFTSSSSGSSSGTSTFGASKPGTSTFATSSTGSSSGTSSGTSTFGASKPGTSTFATSSTGSNSGTGAKTSTFGALSSGTCTGASKTGTSTAINPFGTPNAGATTKTVTFGTSKTGTFGTGNFGTSRTTFGNK